MPPEAPSQQPSSPAALAQLVRRNPQQAVVALQIADIRPQIAAIEQNRGSKLICLILNEEAGANLNFSLLPELEAVLAEIGPTQKLDLLLRSTGGQAEVPWKVVSLLREFCSTLGVVVSRFALSGACHIAIAADDLVMGRLASLGPVDPTRDHPLLPKDANGKTIPTSVQDLKHCIQFVREQLGESYPNQNLALIISELFKYVNPLSIGAIEQTYNLSRRITERVLKTHKTPLSDENIRRIVDALAGQYFSHSYLISRAEVESDLGLSVTRPDNALAGMIDQIEGNYFLEFSKRVPFQATAPEPILRVAAFLQSATSGWAIVQAVAQDGTVVTDPWLKFR